MKRIVALVLLLAAVPVAAIDEQAYHRCVETATNHEHPATFQDAVAACVGPAKEGARR